MIIKIKSHKRDAFKRILEYMMNDRDRLLDQNGNTFRITYNLKGKSITEWVKQYQQNELLRTYRRKDSVRLTHEILSWHRKDAKNITLQKMEDIAHEYIARRSPKGIYVIVPHFDKEHCHLHICVSGVEYHTGKSLRLSKAELLKLKKGIQEYQKEKFPELSNSVVKHGRKSYSILSEKEYQFKLRTGRETNKEQVISMLNTCFNKSSSKNSFVEFLAEYNLKPYLRNGKMNGIIFNGQKFRFKSLGLIKEKFEMMERSNKRAKKLTSVREENLQINNMGSTLEK